MGSWWIMSLLNHKRMCFFFSFFGLCSIWCIWRENYGTLENIELSLSELKFLILCLLYEWMETSGGSFDDSSFISWLFYVSLIYIIHSVLGWCNSAHSILNILFITSKKEQVFNICFVASFYICFLTELYNRLVNK